VRAFVQPGGDIAHEPLAFAQRHRLGFERSPRAFAEPRDSAGHFELCFDDPLAGGRFALIESALHRSEAIGELVGRAGSL